MTGGTKARPLIRRLVCINRFMIHLLVRGFEFHYSVLWSLDHYNRVHYEFWLHLSEPWPQNSIRALSSRTVGCQGNHSQPLPCRTLPGCACIPCCGQNREMPLSGEEGGLLEPKVSPSKIKIGWGSRCVDQKKRKTANKELGFISFNVIFSNAAFRHSVTRQRFFSCFFSGKNEKRL